MIDIGGVKIQITNSRSNNQPLRFSENVLRCTPKRWWMVKRALGNGDRTPNHSWRICHAGHRRGGDGDRASTSVYGTTCVTTISLTSNTQLEKVKKFAYTGWTKYLVNQQLYCTRNALVRLTLERFWKIARILTKLAIRISHSWPTTNCKLLGLRWHCCHCVGPP